MAVSRNKPSADLQERVGAFLGGRLTPGARLWIGLSGGCDSVVLLHAVARSGYAGQLSAIHVHHGLSPNADAWAAACADFCDSLGVPLTVRRVAVDPSAGHGLEAAARAARYAVFFDLAGDGLLLAHHRGDQAETLLFNLLRGTGVHGAAAMPAERYLGHLRLLRPLLGVARSEIEAYALASNLSWVDDESNTDTELARNFLRHDVLPAIGRRFPAAEGALAQAAANFGEAAGLLDELAELDWQHVAIGQQASLKELRTLPLPRLKNVLRHRLRLLGWRVPVAARLDEFARQLQTAAPDRHPELNLPDGRLYAARGLLHWLPAS